MKTVRTAISQRMFEDMLNLPKGVWMRSVVYDFSTGALFVRLEADHFEVTTPINDGDIIEEPFVLPTMGENNTLQWPTLEKK